MRMNVRGMTLEELALELQRVVMTQVFVTEDAIRSGQRPLTGLSQSEYDEIMHEFRRRDEVERTR